MNIKFTKANSRDKINNIKLFLQNDVNINKGSASQVIDIHKMLILITVCYSPWGLITIEKQVSRLEALAWWFSAID